MQNFLGTREIYIHFCTHIKAQYTQAEYRTFFIEPADVARHLALCVLGFSVDVEMDISLVQRENIALYAVQYPAEV